MLLVSSGLAEESVTVLPGGATELKPLIEMWTGWRPASD